MKYLRNGFPYDIEDKLDFELEEEGVPSIIIRMKTLYDRLLLAMEEADVGWNDLAKYAALYQKFQCEYAAEIKSAIKHCGGREDPKALSVALDKKASAAMDKMVKIIGTKYNFYDGVFMAAFYLNLAVFYEHHNRQDDAESCLTQAYDVDMKDADQIRQVKAGHGSAWYTRPLIEMCRALRQFHHTYTAEEMFYALPDQHGIDPIRSIRLSKFDSLKIDAISPARHPDKDITLSSFQKFCSKHSGEIGKRTLL